MRNDKLMTYAEDKHILPLTIDDFECYECVPKEAWDYFYYHFHFLTSGLCEKFSL